MDQNATVALKLFNIWQMPINHSPHILRFSVILPFRITSFHDKDNVLVLLKSDKKKMQSLVIVLRQESLLTAFTL